MSLALPGWLLLHCSQTHRYTTNNNLTFKMTCENCVCVRARACVNVVRSVNERICVGHFLNPAEAQSVHQTCVTDSTPFHKNVVQPPTETHTYTHRNHTQEPHRWCGSPSGAIYSPLWSHGSILVRSLFLILFLLAQGTHRTLWSTVTRVLLQHCHCSLQ